MRAPPLLLPAADRKSWIRRLSFLSLLLAATTAVLPAQAALFTPIDLPNLDLEPLGRIALTGNFDAISLFAYEQQAEGSTAVLNGSQEQSLIAPLPNGGIAPVALADADILALCSLDAPDSDPVIVAGGNFTSLGGVESQGLALFDPNSGRVTAVPELSGQVLALLCEPESGTAYVGGDFTGPDSSNAILWSRKDGFSSLPFGGFNGAVRFIANGQDGHIIFGGSFDGLGNTTSPANKDQQTLNLETAEVSAGASTGRTGFSDPKNIICNKGGKDGPNNTWLLEDNSPGYWRADLRFGFRPTKLRIYNTHIEDRGTKTFRFTALPDNGILNMTYTDPASGDTVACDARCPLSDDPAERFRDFRFVNVVGTSGFQLDISEWYGQGGGLAGIELLEDDIYAYAVNDFNEPACADIDFGSRSTVSGSWTRTRRDDSYDYLSTTFDSSSNELPSVTFQPNIVESGNYSVTVFTPGCVDNGSCGKRGVVNVTATLTSSDTEPVQSFISQTNNFEKYDRLYLGYVDEGSDSFRPTVTLTPRTGQDGEIDVAASRVRFELISSTGGLNGLFDFNPKDENVSNDFSESSVNKAGIDLDRGASIESIRLHNDILFIGGNFSNSSVQNLMSVNRGRASILPGDGLNSAVRDLLLVDDLLFVGGNFTDTSRGGTDGLQHVGSFSTSDNSWVALGSGVDGPVHSLVKFPVNVSSDSVETAVAVSGDFTHINAFDDFPSVPAAGFAVWVPSEKNWLNNLDIQQMAYVGQLTTSVAMGDDTLLAGSLASGGISSHGAASLSSDDGPLLSSLPVDIQLGQKELPARKRASESLQSAGVITGVFDSDSDRNVTVLGGHFTARASDGSVIENLLFFDGSDGNAVTGPPSGVDSESAFLAMAINGDHLFAGGTVTGKVSGSEVGGVVIYDLSRSQYLETQPGALNGDRVVVNAIAPRPGSSDIYVGGEFDSAASLPCVAVCNFESESSQWRRPGSGLQGKVNAMTWSSSNTLIAAGNLTVGGNQTMLASYDVEEQAWSSISGGSSSSISGPISCLGFANEDGSYFWVGGKSSEGVSFLVYYDGTDFNAVDNSLFGEGTTIEGVQILGLTEEHDETDFLNNDQALLVTGKIQLPRHGLVSAALYNGTTLTPFILTSTSDGEPGSIVGLFSENANTFSGSEKSHSRGIVILVSFCLALACIFLIVLIGIIISRVRRYRQGYVKAPQGTDRRPDLKRVPPEYLLDSLRYRPGGGGAPAI